MTLQDLLTGWSFDPVVALGIALSGLLYVRGVQYSTRHGIGARLEWWHIASFYAGLLAVFLALQSAIDVDAGKLLWVHMVQHDLLIVIGPPLLLLGMPAWPLWRALPLPWRRSTLSWMIRERWPWRWMQAIGHALSRPRVAWLLFVGLFVAWHLPVLYDLALEQPLVHILEHLCFLGTALLFWAQVIPMSPTPSRTPRLSYPMQAVYLCAAALVSNMLGAVYMFSTAPLYPFYAALPRAAGEPAALVDQHLAGAAMDAPGVLVFSTAVIIVLWRWLQADEEAAEADGTAHATSSFT